MRCVRQSGESAVQRGDRSLLQVLMTAAALGMLAWAIPARAALIIEAPTITAQAGSSGSFDVILVNTAGSSAFNVAGDSVQLGISGAVVQFADATIATAPAYIFPTSFDADNGLTLDGTGIPFPKTDLTALDTADGATPFQTVNPGDTFGLVHVDYTVDPAAIAGIHELTIEDIGGGTSLSDDAGDAISFTTLNGSLTVTPVPEPMSISLFVAGAICVLHRRRS